MEKNPYAAPRAHVDDIDRASEGNYVPQGIGRPVGRGFSWVADGFRTFFQSPGTWLAIGFLYMLLLVVLQYGPMLLFGAAGSMTGMAAAVGISSLVLMLLYPILNAGVMHGCHALANGEPLSVGHLFRGFSTFPGRLILLGVLSLVGFILVVVIVSLFTGGMMPMLMGMTGAGMGEAGGGAVLLPFLIVLALVLPLIMAILFAPALIGINSESTVSAMLNSFKGCLKNILPFLVYGIAFLVIMILFGIVFGLIAGGLMAVFFRPDTMLASPGTAMIVGMLSGVIMGLLFGLILLPIVMGSIYSSYRDIFYEGGAA